MNRYEIAQFQTDHMKKPLTVRVLDWEYDPTRWGAYLYRIEVLDNDSRRIRFAYEDELTKGDSVNG